MGEYFSPGIFHFCRKLYVPSRNLRDIRKGGIKRENCSTRRANNNKNNNTIFFVPDRFPRRLVVNKPSGKISDFNEIS